VIAVPRIKVPKTKDDPTEQQTLHRQVEAPTESEEVVRAEQSEEKVSEAGLQARPLRFSFGSQPVNAIVKETAAKVRNTSDTEKNSKNRGG
jgi:hypothetical protein